MIRSIRHQLAKNYRYIVLWASMLALLIGSGSIFVLVVALKPIAYEFDWPRAVPSSAYSLQFFCAGVGALAMGVWFDRSGVGPPVLLGAVMMTLGSFVVSGMTTQWEFLISYGLLFGFLGNATLFSPLMANIVNLFERRRGFAAGVVGSGQAFAGAFWPPVIQYFNDLYGWRETYFLFGIFLFCTLVPLGLILYAHRRIMGQVKAPASAGPAAKTSEAMDTVQTHAPTAAETDALRAGGVSESIWMITLSIGIIGCCIAMALPLAHIFSHATDIGHSASSASRMLAVMLLTAGVTRITLMGYVSDRLGSLKTLLLFSVIQTATVGLFVVVDGIVGLYLIAIVFGIGYGGILPLYPVVLRDHLSMSGIGRRTAIIIFFGGIGMALGGWLGGVLHDLTGGYFFAFQVGVAANAVNLVIIGALILRLRRVRLALS